MKTVRSLVIAAGLLGFAVLPVACARDGVAVSATERTVRPVAVSEGGQASTPDSAAGAAIPGGVETVEGGAVLPPGARIFNGSKPMPAPAMQFRGRLIQGGLLYGRIEPGSQMFIDDRALRVGADGTVVFGLDRDAPATVNLRLVRPDGLSLSSSYKVAARDYAVQRVEGISERVMNPTAEDERRIAAEAEQVNRARQRDDDRTDFRIRFIWPAQGPITGVYGSQRVYNGVPKRPHYGVDVGVPTGTTVVAPAAGIITVAHPDMFYSGGTLVIDHGHGVSSTLMHLSALLVREGERVEQGKPVAKSGASGRASGPHLDWRMNWFERRIDPQLLVGPMPEQAGSPRPERP